ncbi:MAG: ankyrin repeat domain-containing protein [Alphaproteobacteria bacterium]|nr:ankyrin repeat domain-containing protein [Alphaproteobacteria bacterium]
MILHRTMPCARFRGSVVDRTFHAIDCLRILFFIVLMGGFATVHIPIAKGQFFDRLPESLSGSTILNLDGRDGDIGTPPAGSTPLTANDGTNDEGREPLDGSGFQGPVVAPSDLHDPAWMTNATADQVRNFIQANPTLDGKPIVLSTDNAGWTPLMRAVESTTNLGIINALLDEGSDVKQKNVWGSTALMIAAGLNPNPAIISELVLAGSKVGSVNNFGMPAIAYATYFQNTPAIVQRLMDHRSNSLMKDASNFSAYDYGLRHPALESTPLLALLAAPVGSASSNKLLDRAFLKDATPREVVEQILDGALVNQRNKEGRTPLHLAGEVTRDVEVVTVLLEYGGSVEGRTPFGSTPLLVSAGLNPNPEIVNALLVAGSDVNARNKEGTTPLIFGAKRSKNPDIITVLLGAGADESLRDDAYCNAADHVRENAALKYGSAYSRLVSAQPVIQQVAYAAEDATGTTIRKQYKAGKKTFMWFATSGEGARRLVLLDLSDYVGATSEGRETREKTGYITTWFTNHANLAENFLPDGYGTMTAPIDRLVHDMPRPRIVPSVVARNYLVFGEGLQTADFPRLPTAQSSSNQSFDNLIASLQSYEVRKKTLDEMLNLGSEIDLVFVNNFTAAVAGRTVEETNRQLWDTTPVRPTTPADTGRVTNDEYVDARLSLDGITRTGGTVAISMRVNNIGNSDQAFRLRLVNAPLKWEMTHNGEVAPNGDAAFQTLIPGTQSTITYTFTPAAGATNIQELHFRLLPRKQLVYNELWQLGPGLDNVKVFVNLQ